MPDLVAIDWGTTSFRAYHLGENEKIIGQTSSPCGIRAIGNYDFESTLAKQLEHLPEIGPDTALLASGMITSRQGWCETPYIDCPSSPHELADGLVTMETQSLGTIWFVPGVKQEFPAPDIMRGEETQIAGIDNVGSAIAILPGTHSKWAELEGTSICRFRTFLTGEIYSLLMKHSILATTVRDSWDEKVFCQGVKHGVDLAAEKTGMLAELFQIRVHTILGLDTLRGGTSWISGMLIGCEIAEALMCGFSLHNRIVVIGSEAVTKRYILALAAIGVKAIAAPDGIAAKGLYRIAQHRKLI